MGMLKLNDITRKFLVLSLTLAGFLSCVEIDEQENGTVGYLAAPQLEVDVTVEDLNMTKALDFEIEAPSVSDIRFVVKDKDGAVKYDGNGLWANPIVLPVGAYTVQATAGENGFGAPYFTGSFSGTISALENETPALTMSLANALVNVTLSVDMKEHFFPGTTLSLNDGAYETPYGQWCYIPAGEDVDVKLSISGLNSVGNEVTFAHTLTSPTPATAYMVTCGKETTDWPSISFSINEDDVWASRIYITTPATLGGSILDKNKKVVYEAIPATADKWDASIKAVQENGVWVIKGLTPGTEYKVRASIGALLSNVETVVPQIDGLSATAVHTTTNGELDGTDVTSAFTKSAVVKNAIESWSINICKADGTPLRSGLPLGTSDGSAITSVTGWPYLPVGSGEKYGIKAIATMDGNDYEYENVSISVPQTPEFSMQLSSYTSYDKYAATNGITKDLNGTTGAYNCDASTLYNAGGKWGISTNIMKNTNYAKTLVIDIDGDTSRTFNVNGDYQDNKYYENISSLGWSAHTLTVSMTFDNKKISKTQTHHITGLPYSAAPPTENDWSKSGAVSFRSGDVRFGNGGGDGSITYTKLHIPGNVNVSVKAKIDAYGAPVNTTSYVEVGGSRVLECTSNSGAFNYRTVTLEDTASATFTTSDNTIKAGTTYGLGTTRGHLYYIEIYYR